MSKNLVAVTIGDLNGIGIELLIQSWKKSEIKEFVLFTNINILKKYILNRKLNIKLNIVNNSYNNLIQFKNNYLNVYTYKASGTVDNSIKSLNYGYKECNNKNFIGLVTLPLNKKIINLKIKGFKGHTEYFQKLDNKKSSNMIFVHKKLFISTLTTHIAIRNINKLLKRKNYIYNQIVSLNDSLKKDFNILEPRILISGINPHAGEKGLLGNEEKNILIPVLNILKSKKIKIEGPISGDSMLEKNNIFNYDCFLFVFHDQALIPFKYISEYKGVNYTGNLSVIRTSPDHGTAYNLVGTKKASNKSLLNCFKLIKLIKKNRSTHLG